MGMVLVLGGASSGKSKYAVHRALESARSVTFIATASGGDQEMADRIRRHRETRPRDWKTIEAPLDLVAAIRSSAADDFVILDCLTLWVSNLLEAGRTATDIQQLAMEAADALSGRDAVVVSNEVGMGIVPANPLAREYRDVLGAVNALFATCAQRVLLMVAGMALELRPA